MANLLPTAPYRGTRDFLPAEMSVRHQVFTTLYQVIEGFGYQRYDGPLLESAEIYEAKSGRELAEMQLYTLTDRGDRRLALRPEMTPTVARMIAANASALQFPVRWYSHPNCFRYERPQRGRVREHWQINVDVFGTDSPRAEIEVFHLVHDMMAALGATRDMYRLRVSDRVLLDGVLTHVAGIPAELTGQVSALIDRWEKMPADQLRADAKGIGLDDDAFTRLSETLSRGAQVIDQLPEDVLAASKLAEVLDLAGDDLFEVDLRIVRGLAYYTGTVFEVFDADPENNRALFGGGRYANLAGLFTKTPIPGIGFGMGDVTLFNFLDSHGLLPAPAPALDVSVVAITADQFDAACDIARRLRAAGLRTATPLEHRKLGKEIQRSEKAGARVVIIIGAKELADGQAVVRDLRASQQQNMPLDDLVTAVTDLLGGTTGH
ncbi:MAG: histidyl-tRNA synthetase [Actinomycetota bacterium]|nr:histidyl-tRNA synthetase [Actinomycetota bacterium]